MKIYKKCSGKCVVLFLLLIITLAGCVSEGGPTASKLEEATQTIEVVAVRKQVAIYTLSLPGELAPFEAVDLYPKVSGFVKHILVDRGSLVKKGQLLARLEAPEIMERYAAASARQQEVLERLQYSHQSYNRYLAASESEGAVAAIELEQARAKLMSDSAAYQSLKAQMSAARQLTAYLEIRAPFAGLITDRMISPGALVGANDAPVFKLAQQDRLRLTIAIPEKHAHALSDTTEIKYRIGTYSNEIHYAKISRSSGVLDQNLRALMVEFDIQNQDRALKGGEYIHAEVAFRRSTPSLWVPSTSIVDSPSGMFVLKIENDTVRRVAVRRGIQQKGFTEVFSDLNENDTIAMKGSEELREGTKVGISQKKERILTSERGV